MTNADRVRAMSDEDLAMWCAIMFDKDAIDGTGDCFEAWLKWLRMEATP